MLGKKCWNRQLRKDSFRQLWRKDTNRVKFNKKQQLQFFLLLVDLLEGGFSLKEALQFMLTVMPNLTPLLKTVNMHVQNGKSLAESLQFNLKPDLYYQLLLAEQHGNLILTLREISKLIQTQEKQRRKLIALLQYPLLLLVLLAVLIIALVIFVFPELQTWQTNNRYDQYLGLIISVGLYFVTSLLVCLLINYWRWQHRSVVQRAEWLCRLPLVGKCYCYYYQYYLLSLIGMMLKRGIASQEIFKLISKFNQQSLLYAFGQRIQEIVTNELQFTYLIRHTPLLPNELIILLKKGTPINHLGAELMVFAELRFKKLTGKIENLLTFVQPFFFMIIAAIIVILYLCILLPIYHSFQGVY